MSKILRFLSPLCVVLFFIAALSPASAQRRPRVAVLDFDYGTVRTSVQAVFGTDVDFKRSTVESERNRLVSVSPVDVVGQLHNDGLGHEAIVAEPHGHGQREAAARSGSLGPGAAMYKGT